MGREQEPGQYCQARHQIPASGADFVEDVLEFADDRRDYGETRIGAIGVVDGIEVHVVYPRRSDVRRIISARRARKVEGEKYRQAYPG